MLNKKKTRQQPALAGLARIARTFMFGQIVGQKKSINLWLVLGLLGLFISACNIPQGMGLPVQPNLEQPYILATANRIPTLTPFQPGEITPMPTWPIPPTETPVPSPTASKTPIPSNTATSLPPTSTATQSALDARPVYNLNVYWDYAGHTLTVGQEIIYPNQSGEALNEILLAVNPNLWRGAFLLTSLTADGQPITNYSLSGQTLTMPLAAPLASGKSLRIDMTYTLSLPYSSGKFQTFGYTARHSNMIDWFPLIPPYFAGQGWLLREPWSYGENFAYTLADFYVGITFGDASPPIVAASAPATIEGNTLRYAFEGARTFSMSASPEFLVATAEENGITIASYYFPEHAAGGQMLLITTQTALRTYQNTIGPYPHTSLAAIETELNDGLESDGLYFLASNFYASYDGSAANNLVMIGAHETAHQWWFGAVSNDQALEPWLDESLCTYAEHIFYEQNYPGLLNWWYNVRIRYYGPSGYVDTRLYNTGSFRQYVNAVYLRGALFLDALRDRMGDAAFFAFLQDYYTRHRGHIATADTFFIVLADHTSSVDDIIKSYFYYR